MGKARYIKGKDGKFAGSIGAGKTAPPTSSPALAPTVPANNPLAQIPSPEPIQRIPLYLLETDTGYWFGDDPLDLPGRPDLAERESWTQVRKQTELEEEFLHGEKGLFTALSKPPTSLFHHGPLQDTKVNAERRAAVLRAEGKHHQAAALEWVAMSANNLSSEFYRIGEDITYYTDHESNSVPAGEDAIFLFQDSDNEYTMAASFAGTCRTEHDKYTVNDAPDPHFVIPLDTMRADARRMFTGAVLMDYLTLTGGDVEAAAVLSSLDT